LAENHILVIDDCPLTLALARDLLEERGFQVITVASGIEANRHIYGSSQPQLILIDVEMPMLQGDRKVRLLKQRTASSHIPVVLMSSKPAEEVGRLSRESGADGFLVKPLTPEKLLPLIESFLPPR